MSATTDGARPGLSRRELLAAGAVTGVAVAAQSERAEAAYPRARIIDLDRLRVNRPVVFRYPLRAQPNVLLDLGGPVPAGVGPNRSIVAFSTLCQHMGCAVTYQRERRELVCPCHQIAL